MGYGEGHVMPSTGSSPELVPNRLDPALIRAELGKVVASSVFAQSERMGQFLQFIVEATLGGEARRLKESVIGVEVYRRSADYDPQIDPIVRTEACRLRMKLRQYYDREGQRDGVVIRLPTGGYVPEFEVRPELAPTLVPIEESPVRTRKRPGNTALVVGVTVSFVAAGVAVAWFVFLRIRQPVGPPTVAPVANYAGYEFDPALSPDGKEVAFVWNKTPGNYDIYAKLIGTESALQLTAAHNPFHDVSPAWSPDGRYIAFLRVSPGKKEVYIVPALGGPARFVCQSTASKPVWVQDASAMSDSSGPAWSPDGKSLAITDNEQHRGPDSIYLASVQTGAKTKLTSPPMSDTGDYFPAFSPDGHYLAFVRAISQRGIADIYVQPLPKGAARRITFDHKTISGLTWASDHMIVFSSNRTGSNMLWAISAYGGAPRALEAAGWNATHPEALPGQHELVYTHSFRITDVWRVALSRIQPQRLPSPEEVIGSQGGDDSAQISPDGTRIAFISDRSGTRQLWISDARGADAIEVTHSGGLPVGTPRWSPDGRAIVYDSVKDGRSVIYVVGVTGGVPQLLAAGDRDDMMPSWSGDGKSVYFLSQRGGKSLELWKKPLAGGPDILLSESADGEAMEAADGRTVYYASVRGGIWEMPAGGGIPTIVPALATVHASRYCFVARRGIYFLKSEIPPWLIEFYSFATHRVSPVVTLNSTPEFDTPSLSVSPDERWLIYSQLDQSGSEIMMIRNFR